ncbi:MAG: glycosyltransferase family 2 protein [Erysipelotrichaceae bacterium]|uniref:Glycosyltransferase family 2 protein n=1 Tax=Faecalicoccus pleomorphus TaxID=1323 RepID=A0A7X9RGW7_9FIRM|nr:glycosyltransferase [Faecalicoccus pleomorphus]MBE6119037.1 glycosyltransferase family 2 protein [Erysipelotrichaceae bacterium]NME44260.1 glycosyltransferase family 2 protein [Faecalicoccus pleomorphus]
MKIGCVILNYNDSTTTINLLNKIKSFHLLNRIIVVDNCSKDNSYQELKEFEDGKIKVIQSTRNGGYGYGNNLGIKYLKEIDEPDFILIANPDVQFTENVINQMIENTSDDVALIAPLTLDMSGNVQLPVAWKVPRLKDFFLFSSIVLNKLFKPMSYTKDYFQKDICEVGCVQGSFFMINAKNIGDRIYDENIFLYFEESCLGKMFQDRGLKTILLTNVTYIHAHSASINKTIKSEVNKRRIMLDSFLQYFKDYYHYPDIVIKIMNLFKKIILVENTILLKIFYD